MAEPNIVLTGFMGTGKTTVGRAVAEQLGWRFVDLDDLIVERAGKPISEIFAQDGETAFRELEASACQELGTPLGWVVATGGGAVLNPANREALGAGGVLICLDADPHVIVQRLAGQDGRPLLAGHDRQARIVDLLAERTTAYEAIPHHVDTSHLSVAAAAEQVMGLAAGLPAGGHCLRLRGSGAGQMEPGTGLVGRREGQETGRLEKLYDVLVAEGVLAQAGQRLIGAGLRAGRCAIITNPTVGLQYGDQLAGALAAAGFAPEVYEIPDGEGYKTLATVNTLYERFAEARLARGEPVIALGGGVVGDLAGFVAATWLRGVPFVQIPTSLLAMVDAGIGGKVAVDLPAGKNLVGAFKQPAVVLIDPLVLATLPHPEFRSGLAEVVKTAIIGAPALFEELAGRGPASLVSMIADTARVKVRLVESDPFETGDRAWLNLGHTFGHALELYSSFTLRHGEAVALGLVAAAELSAGLGSCEPTLPRRVRSLLERLNLPVTYRFDVARVYDLMGTDKKRAGRTLRFVLPRRIGEVAVVGDIAPSAVMAALHAICIPEEEPRL